MAFVLQINVVEPQDYKDTKADYDPYLAVSIAFCVAFFAIGIAVGWVLHKKKMKRYRTRRTIEGSERSRRNRTSGKR